MDKVVGAMEHVLSPVHSGDGLQSQHIGNLTSYKVATLDVQVLRTA
jgi:hypothetical protein